MAYFAPYIDATGLHSPTFADIQDNLVAQAKSIFGQDIYLDNDSQDMQYIAAVSKAIYDAMQMCALAVANQSPQTAIGAPLDSLIKLNGLKRLAATYSTVQITCIGTPGTVIPAGVVQDTAGYKWDLPENSVIPDTGVLSCTATCETVGAVLADIGAIQTIVTPQYGWDSVSNVAAAIAGVPTETDTQLRKRQSTSVQLPSQTPLNATKAAISKVSGVTRREVYENQTDSADANGIPSHSIAVVVEGGNDDDVAQAIATSKTEGCGTYGSTSITLPTQFSIGGSTQFSRPTDIPVDVAMTIVTLTPEYTQAVQDQAVQNITEYLNTLAIGTSVQASSLYLPALSAMADLKSPSFRISSLAISTGGGDPSDNVAVPWNGVATAGTVTVTGGL